MSGTQYGAFVYEDSAHINVDSLYNTEFVNGARDLKGRWSRKAKVWTFDLRDRALVRELVLAVYGKRDDLVRLRLRANAEIRYPRQTVISLAGFPIATTSQAATSAHLAGNVLLVSGSIAGSGATEEWATVVAAGTEVEVKDFPVHRVAAVPDDWEVVSALADPMPKPEPRPTPPEPDPKTWDMVLQRLFALESRVRYLESAQQDLAAARETVD